MNQSKNIQIEYELFQAMISYIGRHPDYTDPDYTFIQHGVKTKLKTMLRRKLYTLYKTASSEDTRAFAREMYLDEMGIPESFRWDSRNDLNVTHDAEETEVAENV